MSDQQFELQKEIANVSQLKSFANFKNNYNKKLVKQPQTIRETITKSNQKLSNSYQKSRSYEREYEVGNQEKKMKVIREEPEASDFYEGYLGVKRNMEEEKQRERERSTQEIVPAAKPRIRPRDFSQTPSFQQPQSPSPHTNLNPSLSHSQRQFPTLKSSLQPPIHQSYYAPPAPSSISHPNLHQQPNSLSSYKTKFQQLSSTFQEFKAFSLVQKRKQKQQSFQNEETIERLKVRVYELEIREDELIMENKKLNEKLTKDFKSQKESQSLKSILQSRTEQLRRAMQEINYYRGQLQGIRKQLQTSDFQSEKYVLELRELRERLEYQQMEVENKQRLQGELTQKISGLIKENARLRDEVSQLFRGNKELEYQNYSMKRELKRGEGGEGYSQYVNQRQNQIQSQVINRGTREEESVIEQPRPQTKRRRGQFNQERNKINERRQPNRQPISAIKQIKQIRDIRQLPKQPKEKDIPIRKQQTSRKEPNPSQKLMKRKDQLQQQISKMKQQKPMNGAMRRIKITLEQQLQQVIIKLSQLNKE